MSENTKNDKSDQPSFGQEVARASAYSFAASAASIVGMFGGLMIVGKLMDRSNKKSDKESQESETTEP